MSFTTSEHFDEVHNDINVTFRYSVNILEDLHNSV
jgi:hypothetical protein